MSWPAATLEELCHFIKNGKSIQQSKEISGLPITRIETIANQSIDMSRVGYAGVSVESAGDFLLEVGDILFSHINSLEHLGKAAIYKGSPEKLVHGMNLLNLRPDQSKVDCGYLLRALRAPVTKAKLLRIANKSVNQASIAAGNLKKIEIPLPPLPEQRRIAAILDKADALRAKRREAIAKLDQLLQSVFLELFGDPVTNPKGWPIVTLSDYGAVATGNTPPRSSPENYGAGIEWIKSDNLNTRHDYVTKAEEQLSNIGVKFARVAPAGSVLVTCIAGSLSCIGNLAITDRPVAFNQQINAITPHNSPSEFLYFLLKAAKPLIQDASTNGMKGMVNKSKFSAIPLPTPPIVLQKEFSRRFREIQKLRSLADAALEKQNTLFAALQQRAFEGKL